MYPYSFWIDQATTVVLQVSLKGSRVSSRLARPVGHWCGDLTIMVIGLGYNYNMIKHYNILQSIQ